MTCTCTSITMTDSRSVAYHQVIVKLKVQSKFKSELKFGLKFCEMLQVQVGIGDREKS